MITQLHIKNFKIHKDTTLTLKNITFLCGQNGVGKSSIIQSLLLLRQSFQKNRLDKVLSLNKPLCYVGYGKDSLYQFAKNNEIIFELVDDKFPIDEFCYRFDVKGSGDKDFIPKIENKNIANKNEKKSHIENEETYKNFSLFNKNFQYISAARTADYVEDDYGVDIEKQISAEEGKAELTAHFLYKYQKEQVNDLFLHHSDKKNKKLLYQTILWQREISKGINIIPQKIGTGYKITYSFDTDASPKGVTSEFTAKNVGFGLSYALPIIVAILSAQKNALIIIENPEAHLVPYGQSKLMELVCLAAQSGVQIIIETHSDHIINGALVACKEQKIDKENIIIYQFNRDEKQHCAEITPINVLEGGRIIYPPQGFFDQISKDRKILMGF